MDETALRAVERSVATMRENLGEPLTMDDVARSAMFSKFHFTRVFQRATGVTPGRFLSAMRLCEAKRLLLATRASVADIGHQVGFQSVGTFSTRFSASVGMSPRTFRKVGGRTTRVPQSGAPGAGASFTIRGRVSVAPGVDVGPVFVGLFPGPIMEGVPVRYTLLDRPGLYTLSGVPVGVWHLCAHSFGSTSADRRSPRPFVCHSGPMTAGGGVTGRIEELGLHRQRVLDPPVLLALPHLHAMLGTPRPVAG
jgi:AraC-like DNA-binding protein